MAETINRALQLLNMLQAHRHWTGTELSRRLGVTERTVRRDWVKARGLLYRALGADIVRDGATAAEPAQR